MRKFILLLVVSLLAGPAMAAADEHVAFYATYVNDGGCKQSERILEGEYLRTGDSFEGRAVVRVAPFGGDCEQNSVTYRVAVERNFQAGGGWDMLVKFGASETAQTATYALAENGMIIPRSDGMPLFATNLPAGVAKVVKAIVGLSRGTPIGEVDFGFNIVPVPWADHEAGQTFHTAWTGSFGEFDAGVNVDIGRSSFGDLFVGWGRGPAAVKLEYAYGLNSIGDGAPPFQMIRGAEFVTVGAPRDWRLAISVGLRWGL